jgi:UDP:flavonoid glycosyltransferase YjiC (YdhE family)
MATKRQRILFFPFNLLSHYLRCLVLANTYDKSVYEVRFLSSEKYNGFVEAQGYEVFSCAGFDADFVMTCTNNFNFDWLNEKDLERVLISQVKCINAMKADVVIGDVAPTLKMAAELAGVRHINLVNGYMTRYYAATRKIPKKHRAYELMQQLPPRVAKMLTTVGEWLTFRKIQAPFNILRKRYNLPAVKDYLQELEGNENLICDMPELFPQKFLPAAYQFIGPLVYQYAQDPGDWQHCIDWNKPLICVCMGSTGDWEQLSFLNDSYYSRYNIVAAGDKRRVLSADHIITRDFVNLNTLLEKASLMICHGGNGTIYTGILNRVFMLCLASHFEQEYNIDALERNGYGKSAAAFTKADWKEQLRFQCEKYKLKQPA